MKGLLRFISVLFSISFLAFLSFLTGVGTYCFFNSVAYDMRCQYPEVVAVNFTPHVIAVVSFDLDRGDGRRLMILPGEYADARFICEANYFFIQDKTGMNRGNVTKDKETILVSND